MASNKQEQTKRLPEDCYTKIVFLYVLFILTVIKSNNSLVFLKPLVCPVRKNHLCIALAKICIIEILQPPLLRRQIFFHFAVYLVISESYFYQMKCIQPYSLILNSMTVFIGTILDN